MSKLTEWAEGLSLSASGRKLVGKAGIVPVRRLADRVGLTDALSSALVRRDFHPVHDRGGVLVSAACAVLLGARSIAGIDVMRQAALVLGYPASASTLYRTLDQVGPVQLAKITSARATVRSRVHDLLDLLDLRPGGFPWIHVDGKPLTGWTVPDIDAEKAAEDNPGGYSVSLLCRIVGVNRSTYYSWLVTRPTSSASSKSSTTAPGSASTPSSATSPPSKPEPGCSKASPPQRKQPLSTIRGELH